MIYELKKGEHRARLVFGLWWANNIIKRDVYFYHDCKYLIEGEDQFDTCKLFGIGFFPSHKNHSARFGWRYNNDTGKILLSAYCYVRGERIIIELGEVNLGEWVRLSIKNEFGKYIFDGPFESRYVVHLHDKILGYPLGVYFGGNKPAPHQMHIEINKIKN